MLRDSWVPDKRYLPKSAYSLNKLLGTPFLGIDLIGDDRCVCLTPEAVFG